MIDNLSLIQLTGGSSCEAFAFIRLSIQSRIAWTEWDHRPVNAFGHQMIVEMRDAIASALAGRRVRVVVIASAVSEYFSAGADLREFERVKAARHAPRRDGKWVIERMQRFLTDAAQTRRPSRLARGHLSKSPAYPSTH
jgi:enoyl-CoA hydratase/carnithine racemase